MNEILQYIAVAIIVAFAVVYLYRHFTCSKKDGCDCCDLKEACNKNKKKENKK